MRFAAGCTIVGLIGLGFAAPVAFGQEDWPARKPISLILPSGAGGSSDPLARLVADEVGQKIGQTILVQNKPGAGGNLGMALAAKAAPDGYTITISWTGPLATNLALYKDVGYDPLTDFAPVGMIGCTPNVLAVSSDLPVRNLKEFEAYALGKQNKVSYGSTGVGSSWHISGEMMNRLVGNSLVHIPYQTPGAALTDLRGGRLDAIFPVTPMTVPHVKSGDIRVLAIFSTERSPVLPDVPTTAEQGRPDLISDTCFAMLAPKGTDDRVVSRLNKGLNDVLSDPRARARIEAMGVQIRAGTPAQLTQYLTQEIPRQAQLVKDAGASAQ